MFPFSRASVFSVVLLGGNLYLPLSAVIPIWMLRVDQVMSMALISSC